MNGLNYITKSQERINEAISKLAEITTEAARIQTEIEAKQNYEHEDMGLELQNYLLHLGIFACALKKQVDKFQATLNQIKTEHAA